IVIDLSNSIPFANYTPKVLLVRSADSATAASDGDFGTLGQAGLGAFLGTAPSGAVGKGFTIVSGTTVTLYNFDPATGTSNQVQAGGSGNRLVLQIAPGTTLPADDYRVYMPNQVDQGGKDTQIFDIFGNQLDGEVLGNPTSQNSFDFRPTATN